MVILLLSTLYITLFILNAASVIPETAEALRVFLFIVLPSIFPLCVLSDWLVKTGSFYYLGKVGAPLMRPFFKLSGNCVLPVIIGLLGSYPSSAKTTGSLYQNGEITLNEAIILSTFTNNAGPLYVIGVIGTNLLNSSFLGFIIWFGQITAGFLVGFILSRILNNKSRRFIDRPNANQNVISTKDALQKLPLSIAESAQTMITVAGTIIFFAALCASLECIQVQFLQSWVKWARAIIEMTTGCQMVSGLSLNQIPVTFQTAFQCCLYAGIVSWGGISVHLQILYIFNSYKIPFKKYIIGKCIHTILSMGITFTLVLLIA